MASEFDRWLNDAAKRNLPNIDASATFLTLYTKNYSSDPLSALQFGYAVMKGKPIFLLVELGQELPDTVRAIAKGIEYFQKDVEGSLEKATQRLSKRLKPYLNDSSQ